MLLLLSPAVPAGSLATLGVRFLESSSYRASELLVTSLQEFARLGTQYLYV